MGEWQPIATAPKDGTPIILLSVATDMRGPKIAIGLWNSEGTSWVDRHGFPSDDCFELATTGVWNSEGGWFQPNEVTHWMPLRLPLLTWRRTMSSELLSWHKVGQKVAVVDGYQWKRLMTRWGTNVAIACDMEPPAFGQIYTIDGVGLDQEEVWFMLKEISYLASRRFRWFPARAFSPVYPQIIDSLRLLHAPADKREAEHV